MPERSLARFADEMRVPCLTVRLPGLPFGEYISRGFDELAGLAADALRPGVEPLGAVNEGIGSEIQEFLGIPAAAGPSARGRRRFGGFGGAARDEFLVDVPGWQDLIRVNNEAVFRPENRESRALDYADGLRASPVPPSVAELGELLTTLDDVQDEAATLAVGLTVVERLAGRAIPGVGSIAFAADGLNALQNLARPLTGLSGSRRQGKRRLVERAYSSGQGLQARIENTRRTGRLKVGAGDLLQGVQATESLFGTGIVLGPVFGALGEVLFGSLRGATVRFPGPAWDPLGFSTAAREACVRSPALDSIHPRADVVLSDRAFSLWSKAALVLPYVDALGEDALFSTLTGLRLAEGVLGPWLRSGLWEQPLADALAVDPVVGGGVAEAGTRRLPARAYALRTHGGVLAAVRRAILAVPDPGRQAFYESLVASVGWGFLADLEPEGVLAELHVSGPLRDPFLLAEADLVPRWLSDVE